MSLDGFLRFLQSLISMTNSEDHSSLAYAKSILQGVYDMAVISKKADAMTLNIMGEACYRFEVLIDHQASFAGIPGNYHHNEAARQMLLHTLQSSC